MSSFYGGNNPNIDYSGAQDAVALAKRWATYLGGPVEGLDYSSKQYAINAGDAADVAVVSSNQAGTYAAQAKEAADKLNEITLSDLVDVSEDVPLDAAVLTWEESRQLWIPSLIVTPGAAQIQALAAQMLDLKTRLQAAGII